MPAPDAQPAAGPATEPVRSAEFEAQQRLALLIRRSPLAVVTWDLAHRVREWNPAAERIFGFSAAEAIGMHFSRLVPPEVHRYVEGIFAKLFAKAGGERSRNENVTREGRRIICEWYNVPLIDDDGRVWGVASMAQDVTEEHRAQRALVQREEDLRLVTDSVPALIAAVDPLGRFRFVNRPFARWLGRPQEWFAGKTMPEALGPDAGARLAPHVERALSGQTVRFEDAIACADAITRDVDVTYVPRLRDGRPAGFFVLAGDASERRAAEARVRASEALFRQMAATIDSVFWMIDLRPRRLAYMNPAFEKVWGRSIDSVAADITVWDRALHPEDRARVLAEHRHWVYHSPEPALEAEYRIVRPDGSVRWVLDRCVRVVNERGKTVRLVGVAQDVTRRKLAETELANYRGHLESLVAQRTAQLQQSREALARAERLASLGTLAAGLGHDINNMVLPMRCALDALRAPTPERAAAAGAASAEAPAASAAPPRGQTHDERLATLERSLDFLARLSSSLLTLAAAPDDAASGHDRVDLHAWWRQDGSMLSSALPRGVRLAADLPAYLPEARIAPVQLSRAVLNLIVNAAEAAGAAQGSAHDTDETARAQIRLWADVRRAGPSPAGQRWVVVGVSDHGSGMTEDVRRHALDPFFTTKKRGLSTGLGLSLVHAAVSAVGGSVEIDSTPGLGTEVRLILPAVIETPVRGSGLTPGPRPAPAAVGATATPSPTEPLTPPTAWITVADDRVAGVLAGFLEAWGWLVRRPDGPVAGPTIPPAGVGVWLTDPAETVRAWLQQRPAWSRARVIVLGRREDGWALPGVVALEQVHDVQALARALLPLG